VEPVVADLLTRSEGAFAPIPNPGPFRRLAVFLHGHGGRLAWQEARPELWEEMATRGFDVLAVTSPLPDGSWPGILGAEYVVNRIAAHEAVRPEVGPYRDIVVVAFSQGTRIATFLAAMDRRVSGLALYASSASPLDPIDRSLRVIHVYGGRDALGDDTPEVNLDQYMRIADKWADSGHQVFRSDASRRPEFPQDLPALATNVGFYLPRMDHSVEAPTHKASPSVAAWLDDGTFVDGRA
jgi:pimeloyl-ACP methyl ester carboxylesterase